MKSTLRPFYLKNVFDNDWYTEGGSKRERELMTGNKLMSKDSCWMISGAERYTDKTLFQLYKFSNLCKISINEREIEIKECKNE